MKKIKTIYIVFLIFFYIITLTNNLNADTQNTDKKITIGYQKFLNEIANPQSIQPFIQYLKNEFPDYQFQFLCLSDDTLIRSLSWGELDFAICNPYTSILAGHINAYSFIATIVRKGPEGITEYQAGTIFCGSDREDINTIRDVIGKKVCIPGKDFFAGWILPYHEFKKQGIEPDRDFNAIVFAGNHEDVLQTVLTGNADVGCISAFYLWKFIQEGKIKEESVKIINNKRSKVIAYPYSTDVFPEACCIAHSTIPEEVKKKMLLALLKIPPGSPEAQCIDSAGWIPHLSYTSVEELVRKLRLPPFEEVEKETTVEFIKRQRYFIISFLVFWTLLIVAISSIIYAYKIMKTNKMLEYSLKHSKIARRSLEESERRYKLLTENFPGTVYICKNDEFYTMLYLTDAVYNLTGYTKDEFISTKINFSDIFHPEDRDYIFNEVDDKLRQRLPYHLFYRIQHRDGHWVWIEEIGTGVWDDGNLLYLQGYLWDITQQKNEEEKQKEKNERLIIENDILTCIVTHPDVARGNFEGLAKYITEEIGKKLKVPRVNVWLFNDKRTQLECIDHYDLFSGLHSAGYVLHEEEFFNEFQELKRAKYVDAYNALEDPRTKGYTSNYLIPLNIKSMLDVGIRIGEQNKGVICFEYTGEKHIWDNDEITFACQVADQLALTLMNRDKLKSEQQRDLLIQTVETAEEGILITDKDEVIIYTNPAVKIITGKGNVELSGKHLSSFLENGMKEEEYQEKIKSLKGGKMIRGQLEWTKNDGNISTIEYSISPLFNEQKELMNIVMIFRDITYELKLQNDLKQSQKMESIGQLAGGIAHDLNNHLMVINGYAELAERELHTDSPIVPYIQEIIKANQKASSLVRQLLAFARKQVLKKEIINVNELVYDICKILQRLLRENIELTFIPDTSIPMISADKNAIEVILINLCVNANDAMPDGGKLLIETSSTYISKEMIEGLSWTVSGDFVVISITDTGIGMDKYTLEHCFDPFFTTKETGKGTGLGLSTVYGLVQQHNGIIHVYSEVRKGTTFKIYLPATHQEQIQQENTTEKGANEQLMGNETILIAEDELSVRSVAMRILEQAGYRVLSAKDGEECVKLFLENINAIDLVILDVIMPIMDGKEVYEKIKAIRPDLPVLFSTGYSENSIHTNFVLDKNLNLINKPYGRQDLLRTVRNILDKKHKH
ncbi:MAG: PhnD/SsuA/transferrin family substrate-binding protein [Candidatus Hydrogenedens sp.]